jgi:hypothetical protein
MCSTSLIDPVLRLAGIEAACAMLSESMLAATVPPARERKRRRSIFSMPLTPSLEVNVAAKAARPKLRSGDSALNP